ncbi:conserved protein of unknown function [Sterolibacterium denitrificans]|uniref:Uncharacterized protein n=2 Tax=Sterolibacterium denitrificans TaxID=157592 RepID=A0A7Z7HV23_9PROT|nr:molybdopterin-binding protein [Sterolibacterium denitrificans]KYC29452.1 hypothetical protein ACY05_02830 [Sterolibacterium denitrificans]SMB31629.1 conserved protein of unknown function [Sterolibacterium denitrificans]
MNGKPSRSFGALIIGDEIIRGKRQDKHFQRLVDTLAARGLHLTWSLYVADERPRLIEILRRTLQSADVVFSFGGIGVTPDDHTRQAAAAAAGVSLQLHPDAETEIRAYCAQQHIEVTPQRLLLGELPAGSRIVPNPVNHMPGFSLGDHHFYPGFPQMAWPMLEWTLETYYQAEFHAVPESEQSIYIQDGMEGPLLPLMQMIETKYRQAHLFSLPSLGDTARGRTLELGMRGEPAQVAAAMIEIRAEVTRLGFIWKEAAATASAHPAPSPSDSSG